MAYNPVSLVSPTLVVSPQGGGTLTAEVLNSGNFNWGAPEYSGEFRNYRYTIKPNPGYRFVRLDILSPWYSQHTGQYLRDNTLTAAGVAETAVHGVFKYETNLTATDAPVDVTKELGSSWWWLFDLGYGLWSDSEITALTVTAVFEKRGSGRLVYSENQNGLLVYSVAQGGGLMYDG